MVERQFQIPKPQTRMCSSYLWCYFEDQAKVMRRSREEVLFRFSFSIVWANAVPEHPEGSPEISIHRH